MRYFCLWIVAVLVLPASAKSDIIITVQNANLTTNGTGFVDVLISSSLASEQLAQTTFAFSIGGSPNLRGSLEFLEELDDANYSPPNYVFGPATGNFGDFLNSPTEISGGDTFEAGETNVTLTPTAKTLVRLNLKHTAIGDPELAVGGSFTVSLSPPVSGHFSSVDDAGTPGDTLDDVFTPLNIDPLSSFTGTITITSAAVPEPSTFAVLAMLGVGAIGRKLRQRKMLQTNLEPSSSQD
ncbi:MAG: PEP-CTERM sorting domain-containing protein [Planctomycetales bacterium]|nr:PEP-CTERM sorting domain-containing protein [Planctomycetales bacterium]